MLELHMFADLVSSLDPKDFSIGGRGRYILDFMLFPEHFTAFRTTVSRKLNCLSRWSVALFNSRSLDIGSGKGCSLIWHKASSRRKCALMMTSERLFHIRQRLYALQSLDPTFRTLRSTEGLIAREREYERVWSIFEIVRIGTFKPSSPQGDFEVPECR